MLRMQMAFRDRLLQGMDVVAQGNIPVAAGMSSSSALVVSTAEAAAALHGLEVTPSQFVNFCGEGEWFVGTRGGSADHAAMKYGAKGTINHVKFHEFELLEQIPFPDTHRMVVCNSFMQAKKAAGARIAFNSRVASYALGVELVRHAVSPVRAADSLRARHRRRHAARSAREDLRDPARAARVHDGRAGAADVRHARGLAVSGTAFRAAWKGERVYPVRGVMWFGIAECARSREAAVCLKRARHGSARPADEDLARWRTVFPRAGRPAGRPRSRPTSRTTVCTP